LAAENAAPPRTDQLEYDAKGKTGGTKFDRDFDGAGHWRRLDAHSTKSDAQNDQSGQGQSSQQAARDESALCRFCPELAHVFAISPRISIADHCLNADDCSIPALRGQNRDLINRESS
jgi:hypothetical protein